MIASIYLDVILYQLKNNGILLSLISNISYTFIQFPLCPKLVFKNSNARNVWKCLEMFVRNWYSEILMPEIFGFYCNPQS